MKKLSLLFVAYLFVLTSCSSDDSDSSSNISGDILGTWVGVDVDYYGDTVTEAGGQTVTSDFVGEAYDVDYTLTFTENPNELVSEGSYSVELTTTTLGQTQVDNIENLEFLEDGTWTQEGNQLTITNNGVSSQGTILELTDTSLVLELNQETDLSQPGYSIINTVNVITTFTRM
ncbi:lipocalin family protein [Winogradskyella sp. SYSU M77433]|uniref:lipocalin family protein n=1 Tax=Winogradskyella sp. SYSU M77433 TaxID=3042722 RepID=UPI002480F03D|nr:lipocalin family protein [Winogradskyella sp. SYSU M77433]MDH7912421.1 lipocalin family protein [Winogradskyella sp. SYSU M77433]